MNEQHWVESLSQLELNRSKTLSFVLVPIPHTPSSMSGTPYLSSFTVINVVSCRIFELRQTNLHACTIHESVFKRKKTVRWGWWIQSRSLFYFHLTLVGIICVCIQLLHLLRLTTIYVYSRWLVVVEKLLVCSRSFFHP